MKSASDTFCTSESGRPTEAPAAGSAWVCCQLGAREHFAIPCVLHQDGKLALLYTDTWVAPSNPLGKARQSLRERHHPDLSQAPVASSNSAFLRFELGARLRGLKGWARIQARNACFERQAIKALESLTRKRSAPMTLFAYSYAARNILAWAKARGWKTVLGQIDPGPFGETAGMLATKYPGLAPGYEDAPIDYWAKWREECALADCIVVNSEWSRECLIRHKVAPERIKLVRLAFQPPGDAAHFQRSYPKRFTQDRPLRVLFLGQISLRKGAGEVLEAADLLAGEPVEFWMVGPLQLKIGASSRQAKNVRWLGAVPRSATAQFYRDADVFLFPTWSDGFGLTQLEAQAWKLPVIASRFCGDVVVQEKNGIVLDEISGPSIAKSVKLLLAKPELLWSWSSGSTIENRFSENALAKSLAGLFDS